MTMTSGTIIILNTGPRMRNALGVRVMYSHFWQLNVLEQDPPPIASPASHLQPRANRETTNAAERDIEILTPPEAAQPGKPRPRLRLTPPLRSLH